MAVTTVLLVKENSKGSVDIDRYYIDPLIKAGVSKDSILILPLLYNMPSKVLAKTAKAYLDKLINKIPDTVTNLIIADSSYFKFITAAGKVSTYYGTSIIGKHKGYEKFNCVYVPNYKSLFKNPENKKLIYLGIETSAGKKAKLDIHSSIFGFKHGADKDILDSLYKHPLLTADIETTGLALDSALVSIAFAWTKHDGVAIDLSINGVYELKKFLENYTGILIFHNALFDLKLLIRNLWMKHNTDYDGMLEGLSYFRNCHDTMLLTFVAKNATTHVPLGLKEVALEYVGNYALELEDITKYSKKEILKYNLIDVLGTYYVLEQYHAELDSRIYKEILQPSIYTVLKMMLVGLPMDSERVEEVHNILTAKTNVLKQQIAANDYIQQFNKILQEETCVKANSKLKKLVKTVDQFEDVEFNPGSDLQMRKLLFDMLDLPILETTDGGAPSVKADVLKDLENHTDDSEILDLLTQVQELSDVIKINGTFIKAFKQEKDFLHGSLKLGGTQSGRLSCLVGNSMVLS